MENWIKQIRERFSGLEQESRDPNSISRRIPSRKSVSSKAEKEGNWLWRQMGRDGNSSDSDFKTAVAAAAFAVSSLEEPDKLSHQKRRQSLKEAMDGSMDKANTRKEEQDPGRISRISTVKKVKEENQPSLGEASMKKPVSIEQNLPARAPSVKKLPSFPEKKQSGNDTTKPVGAKDTRPVHPAKPMAPKRGNHQTERQKVSEQGETKADAWERAKLDKIQRWYEKTNSEILSWEGERKAKARHHRDKRERELERRRVRASKGYHMEIARIEKIAREAKAIADEKKRNDETKIKEKARKFRSTGKLPVSYFCF